MRLPFVKMQGCGNDFIVLDGIKGPLPDLEDPKITRFLCDRRFGIGCDQLLVAKQASRPDADFQMRVYNSDASQVEMCGNGIRCLAKWLTDKGYHAKARAVIETLGGLVTTERMDNGQVKVDMGVPVLEGEKIPAARKGQILNYALPVDQIEGSIPITCVSMGNPHCVIFVDELDAVDFNRLGPYLSTHPFFPNGVNVEFVELRNRQELRLKVWERGAGPTLACGTGASASAVAAVLAHKAERHVSVELPGGSLLIDWDASTQHVFMTGPAQPVYEGVIQV